MAWRDRYKSGSGNPSGAPRAWDTFAAIFQELLDGPYPIPASPEGETVKRRGCRVLVAKWLGGDLAAYREIAERVEGKVPDILNLDANVHNDSPVREEEVSTVRDYIRHRNGATEVR